MNAEPASQSEFPNLTPNPFLYSIPFLLLVAVSTGILSELGAMALRGSSLRDSLPPYLVVPLVPMLVGALIPYLLIRFVYRSTLRDFGIRWIDPTRRALPWFLGASAFALLLWLLAWTAIYSLSLLAPDNEDFAKLSAANPIRALVEDGFDHRKLAFIVHFFILVGFAEELFGRGLLQNALDRRYRQVLGTRRFNVRLSTLIAAALFAFWHTVWLGGILEIFNSFAMSMTIVMIPSLLLAIVYEKTRSMLAAIALHNVIDGGKLLTWYVTILIFQG